MQAVQAAGSVYILDISILINTVVCMYTIESDILRGSIAMDAPRPFCSIWISLHGPGLNALYESNIMATTRYLNWLLCMLVKICHIMTIFLASLTLLMGFITISSDGHCSNKVAYYCYAASFSYDQIFIPSKHDLSCPFL